MSRIGKTPIEVPKDATLTVDGKDVVVKGPKGTMTMTLPDYVTVAVDGAHVVIACKKTDTKHTALHGFVRAELANMVKGVTVGFTKTLELAGVGYRAAVSGSNLVLTVGFSHAVTIIPPPGITLAVVEGKIVVSGINKQLVGQIAANIREVRKPEPYKGKGIKYVGEHIRKKAGKSAKAIGGTGTGAAAK